MKIPPLVLIGAMIGAALIVAIGYFGLNYLRSKPVYHEAKVEEMQKKAAQSTPSVAKSAPAAPAPPPPPVLVSVPQAPSPGGAAEPSEVAVVPKGSTMIPAPPPPPQPPILIDTPKQKERPIEVVAPPSSREMPAIPQDTLAPMPPQLPGAAQARTGPPVYSRGRYLFRNLSSDLDNDIFTEADQQGPNIDIQTFAPEGEPIDVVLINNVASNQLEVQVVGAVWTPFFWNGRQILEVGDHILGTASAGHNRDRIIVNWKKIVLKDGRTLPIDAIGLHTDGTLGVKGYKVGNLFQQAAGPLMADFVSGVSQALQQRITTTTNSPFGTTTVTSNGGGNILEQAAGYAGQNMMQRLSTLMAQDMADNAPYVFVPAGTRCQAYLKAYIDVSLADYGK